MKLNGKTPWPQLTPWVVLHAQDWAAENVQTALSLRLLRYSGTSLNILWGAIPGQNPNQERAGISSLPVTLQAACRNTCPQIQGDGTLQKAFLWETRKVPTRFLSQKWSWISNYKTNWSCFCPFECKLEGTRTKINTHAKKIQNNLGWVGEQLTRECKPPLAQFHYIKLLFGLIQLRFEDHQAYPFLTINSSIKVGIWNQLQRNIPWQKKPSHTEQNQNKGRNNAQNT